MTTVNAASANPSANSATRTKLAGDFDQFLALLTTQLKNQDPLSPMETAEFTNQLVGFSQVEQQINTNEKIEALLSMQSLNLTALGVSFIGKNVEIEGKNFMSDGTKPVELSYSLPLNAKTGTVSILDKDGNVVYSAPAELKAGTHTFSWDGKDKNGQPVPTGSYELKVGALGEKNEAIKARTYVPGYVKSLESDDNGSLLLNVNGEKIPLGAVRKISTPTI